MYKQCKTEQSARRQRQLEKGLQRMMLTRRYEDITVSSLCSYLAIPRKAFYRYFSSKDGALFAMLDHTMMEFYAQGFQGLDGSGVDNLRGFFLFWYSHRELLEALERSHLSGMMIERATIIAQQEKLMPRKILSWSVDLQGIAMSFTVSGLMAMVFQWHHQKYRTSPEEITQAAIVLLTKPLIHDPRSVPHRPGD